jgi:hypothetical protein
MEENPYEAPKVPGEPGGENRWRTFLAVSAPLALTAAAVAFCTMCTMNGAMQSSPMWSPRWWVATCILAVAGLTLLGSLICLAARWIREA